MELVVKQINLIQKLLINPLFSVILMCLVISCTSKKMNINKQGKMTNQDIGKIESLLYSLKDENLSIKQVLEKHYLYANIIQASDKDSKTLLEALLYQLGALRKDLRADSTVIYSWEKAKNIDAGATKNLLENDIKLKDVFVVFVHQKPKYYIKIKNKKVQSLTPMLKGETIVGWL